MRYRTFIAVDVEPFTRDRLAGLQEQLAAATEGVKWVETSNLHLTLLFLGEVDSREVPALCRAVDSVASTTAPFVYTLTGLGAFPTPRRPRTLIAKVGEGAEELKAIHAALEAPLLELGCYRREERPFNPHVTIGRVKRDGSADILAATLLKFAAWEGGQTRVRDVKVLASNLKTDGPEYTLLSRSKLSGKAP